MTIFRWAKLFGSLISAGDSRRRQVRYYRPNVEVLEGLISAMGGVGDDCVLGTAGLKLGGIAIPARPSLLVGVEPPTPPPAKLGRVSVPLSDVSPSLA